MELTNEELVDEFLASLGETGIKPSNNLNEFFIIDPNN